MHLYHTYTHIYHVCFDSIWEQNKSNPIARATMHWKTYTKRFLLLWCCDDLCECRYCTHNCTHMSTKMILSVHTHTRCVYESSVYMFYGFTRIHWQATRKTTQRVLSLAWAFELLSFDSIILFLFSEWSTLNSLHENLVRILDRRTDKPIIQL